MLPNIQELNNAGPRQQVELFISCQNLKNMDILSLTDPQVKLFQEENGKSTFLDQTEIINDNLNPQFAKSFALSYFFEMK
mmetsp:Transcript_24516/g.21690  ORF Transcript_24516/g.21690 Transcript_24516/m.21690 type:complete len:80 (-) Transcript_24516:1436-1675(-)